MLLWRRNVQIQGCTSICTNVNQVRYRDLKGFQTKKRNFDDLKFMVKKHIFSIKILNKIPYSSKKFLYVQLPLCMLQLFISVKHILPEKKRCITDEPSDTDEVISNKVSARIQGNDLF